MTEQYGRRKDDGVVELPPEMVAKLTDSQKINVQIIQNLTSINTALNDLQHDLNIIQKTVEKHDTLMVTGNGEPSFQERLRNVESYISNIRYWSRFIGGVLVTQTLAGVIGFVLLLIRLIPILERLASK